MVLLHCLYFGPSAAVKAKASKTGAAMKAMKAAKAKAAMKAMKAAKTKAAMKAMKAAKTKAAMKSMKAAKTKAPMKARKAAQPKDAMQATQAMIATGSSHEDHEGDEELSGEGPARPARRPSWPSPGWHLARLQQSHRLLQLSAPPAGPAINYDEHKKQVVSCRKYLQPFFVVSKARFNRAQASARAHCFLSGFEYFQAHMERSVLENAVLECMMHPDHEER